MWVCNVIGILLWSRELKIIRKSSDNQCFRNNVCMPSSKINNESYFFKIHVIEKKNYLHYWIKQKSRKPPKNSKNLKTIQL